MGDLYLRAIETNENIDKVVNDGFAPAIILDADFNKNVLAKIEMKKIKRILRRNRCNQSILVKLKNITKNYIISNLVENEITGNVSYIEFKPVKSDMNIQIKIPIVFNYTNAGSDNTLCVNFSEIEVVAPKDKIPDFISIDVGNKKQIKISDLKIDKDLKPLLSDDIVIAKVL